MEKILSFFDKLGNYPFKTNSTLKGFLTIQQTERNNLKAESIGILADILRKFFADHEINANVDIIKEGLVISAYNDTLQQEICFIINPTIPALAVDGVPFDVQIEAENYAQELQAKAEEKAKKESAKRAKAQRDAELREQARAERERRKAERES